MRNKKRAAEFNLDSLPEGLRERGRPLSIHRPWGDVVADAQKKVLKLMGAEAINRFVSGPILERIALFTLAIVLFVAGAVALWFYKYNPPKKEDPVFVLITAVASFVLGGIGLVSGIVHIVLKGRAPGRRYGSAERELAGTDAERPRYYLVYEDGLATVTGDTFAFLAWTDIKEVGRTWKRLDNFLTLTDSGDRAFIIANGYSNAGELRLAIFQNVNRCLLPKALKRIAAGKSAKFGPFAVSRAGLKYKDRTADWDDVTSMKLQTYRGQTSITIYVRGRLLWWCWHDIHEVPNHETFYDVLCHVAPEHLLTTSSRPRW
jgi:hypothetical protein